jgi:hypothetical protein
MKTRINTIDRVISKDGLDDVCCTIHYTFYKEKTVGSGDDAVTYSASVYGTVRLDSPDADNFTAYADVTEANAISWCEAKIKLKDVDEVKKVLND